VPRLAGFPARRPRRHSDWTVLKPLQKPRGRIMKGIRDWRRNLQLAPRPLGSRRLHAEAQGIRDGPLQPVDAPARLLQLVEPEPNDRFSKAILIGSRRRPSPRGPGREIGRLGQVIDSRPTAQRDNQDWHARAKSRCRTPVHTIRLRSAEHQLCRKSTVLRQLGQLVSGQGGD
jgi:hypothetical protein